MKHAAACVSPFLASELSIIDSRSGRDSYCLTREVTHRNRGSCYLASPAAFRRIQIHVESAWFFVTNCMQRSPSPNTRGAIVAVLLVRARPPGGGISNYAWNSARCYLASPAAFRRIQIHVESVWFFVTNCKQRSPSPNTRGAIVAVCLLFLT